MPLQQVTLGSSNLKGSWGFGKKEDYTYSVPQGTLHVSLTAEDKSANTLNIGNGNGKVTLQWPAGDASCNVHAYVNGALGKANEVAWTVTAWVNV